MTTDKERLDKLEKILRNEYKNDSILFQQDWEDGIWLSRVRGGDIFASAQPLDYNKKTHSLREAIDNL